jgi:hypothetical protein
VPGSVAIAAFVFGALLILVAILGGGFKVFGAEVSGTVGTPLRVVAGVLGTGVLLGALYPSFQGNNPFGSNLESTSPSASNESPSGKSALKVNYYVDETSASMDVGNAGNGGVIIVRQPTLHWEYKPCPKLTPSTGYASPSVLATHEYRVRLSASDGSHLLDRRPFKYGPGQVDSFYVAQRFADNGIYTVWLSFRHRNLGDDEDRVYKTRKETLEVCARFSR